MTTIGSIKKVKLNSLFKFFGPDSTVSEIADLMDLEDIGAVPILDESYFLLGIVSERDIVRKLVKNGRDSDLVTAKDIMSTNIKSVTLETKVYEAQLILTKNKIRHLPVTDSDNKLINFLSQRDLLAGPIKNIYQILTFIGLAILLGLIAVIMS